MYYRAFEDNITTPNIQECVVLSGVLPHQVNRGYQDWKNDVVAEVQGQSVTNLEHFNKLLDGVDGKWVKITFQDHSILVLDLEEAHKASEQILSNFSIAKDRFPLADSNSNIQ